MSSRYLSGGALEVECTFRLPEEPKNPSEDVYGGMILGRKTFIKEILQRLNDTDRKQISCRKTLHASTVDLDDIVALVAARFKISKERALTSSPYRNYAVYLSKKHTALSNPQIGAYFGNITFSAVTKIASRLAARMKKDRSAGIAVEKLEKKLSTVKG
jgi:chromosomal replication initiation ATPase DnaA